MSTEPRTAHGPLHILDERLHADPSRVVLRPFHLGWQAANAEGNRALRLVNDVAALSENRVREEYRKVFGKDTDLLLYRKWMRQNR